MDETEETQFDETAFEEAVAAFEDKVANEDVDLFLFPMLAILLFIGACMIIRDVYAHPEHAHLPASPPAEQVPVPEACVAPVP